MTKKEALKMLDEAPQSDMPAKINKSFTQKQTVDIIRTMVQSPRSADPLNQLAEKRVWQVYKNQRRPKYKAS